MPGYSHDDCGPDLIRDHIGQITDRDPNAEAIVVGYGPCEVCGELAIAHVSFTLHPWNPDRRLPYGDGRIHDHVARVLERDPAGWLPQGTGNCDDCGVAAEAHDEVEIVRLEDQNGPDRRE